VEIVDERIDWVIDGVGWIASIIQSILSVNNLHFQPILESILQSIQSIQPTPSIILEVEIVD
jgi:hypothetical protein